MVNSTYRYRTGLIYWRNPVDNEFNKQKRNDSTYFSKHRRSIASACVAAGKIQYAERKVATDDLLKKGRNKHVLYIAWRCASRTYLLTSMLHIPTQSQNKAIVPYGVPCIFSLHPPQYHKSSTCKEEIRCWLSFDYIKIELWWCCRRG